MMKSVIILLAVAVCYSVVAIYIPNEDKDYLTDYIEDDYNEENVKYDFSSESEPEPESEDDEEPSIFNKKDDSPIANKKDGIDVEHSATLDRLRKNQREDHLKGTVTGSILATNRLMNELREIYQSESFKNNIYSVELVDDSLYEWIVQLRSVDPDSELHNDLVRLKEKEGIDGISLNIIFNERFPFEPPFVRVVYPIISSGSFVLSGGAICMELLTKQGWSSAYTIEALLMQIGATLVAGKARISFGSHSSQYSMDSAKQAYKQLVELHEKRGWYTPPKREG